MIRAVLTDIEGTTSSIAFVKDVLFPYASRAMADFLAAQGGEPRVARLLNEVRGIGDCPQASRDDLVILLLRWIAEDRKVSALKSLQGLIWRNGYERGDFRAHVYPDAVAALSRWHDAGLRLYVYSSGSSEAQQLFFGHSEAGDLTRLFSGYFDTQIGAKAEVESYRQIAAQLGMFPENILFLSDLQEELDAAAEAGMRTCWLRREPERQIEPPRHPVAASFAEVQALSDAAA